ncbi:NfeD family protein [Vibrio breoganii]|uniref:NfeD family protein n=1 Tax=Vibrio breoganii TaxID=553239 RepID=UPI000C843F6C|nr:NfeD family protein [Vibrio breoganii]PML13948.1 hypothetical protein BCT84_12370 [Vibrio breoganii]
MGLIFSDALSILLNWWSLGIAIIFLSIWSGSFNYIPFGLVATALAVISVLKPLPVVFEVFMVAAVLVLLVVVWWQQQSGNSESEAERLGCQSYAISQIGEVLRLSRPFGVGVGELHIDEDVWIAQSREDLALGQKIEVHAVEGTILQIRPVRTFSEPVCLLFKE